jgi:hypothetical protein
VFVQDDWTVNDHLVEPRHPLGHREERLYLTVTPQFFLDSLSTEVSPVTYGHAGLSTDRMWP